MKALIILLVGMLTVQGHARNCETDVTQASDILRKIELAIATGNATRTSQKAALLNLWEIGTYCGAMSPSFFCANAPRLAAEFVRDSELEVKAGVRSNNELSNAKIWLEQIQSNCR